MFLTLPGADFKKQQKKKPRKHGGLSGTSSDESEDSDKESDSDDSFKSVSSADEDDDFNPFRDESDDDDEDGKILSYFKVKIFNVVVLLQQDFSFLLDPWLIRKEPKKGKDKKKKRRSVDPDSIHSALLASGLSSTRPSFTTPVNAPNTPPPGKKVATKGCRNEFSDMEVTSSSSVKLKQRVRITR